MLIVTTKHPISQVFRQPSIQNIVNPPPLCAPTAPFGFVVCVHCKAYLLAWSNNKKMLHSQQCEQ